MSTLKVGGIRGVSASSDAITVANDGTCTANVTNNLSNRNLIINGAMEIAQRGTSSTDSGYQTVDRFKYVSSGVDTIPTQAQVDVTAGTTPYTLGFRKAYKVTNADQTTGATTNDRIRLEVNLEAQDIANSGWNYTSSSSYITLSFWVRSSVAQNFFAHIRLPDGTSQAYGFETGSLSANTWTKVTKTIPGNSNLTFDNDAELGWNLVISMFHGTDYTSSSYTLNQWAAYSGSARQPNNTSTWYTTNGATWEITGLQLEVGEVATDFEHRSFGQELALCQRYYIFNGAKMGNCGKSYSMSSFDMIMSVNYSFPVQMRATPSVTTTDVVLKNDSDGNETANINNLSQYGHQYGIKKVGGSSEEYAIQIQNFKYNAEL